MFNLVNSKTYDFTTKINVFCLIYIVFLIVDPIYLSLTLSIKVNVIYF